MCIVIDINTLAPVFSNSCEKHSDFSPIKKWIEEGHGFLVFGGTKYKAELNKTFRYLTLIRKMKDGGRAIAICDSAVDALEVIVKEKTLGTKCNDQHLIALLAAAKCTLLCSNDSRAFKFIKDRGLYPEGMAKVKIYSSSKNRKLLTRSYSRTLTNVE